MNAARPKVVITHWVHPEVLHLLGEHAQTVVNPTRETLPRDKILQLARDANGLLAFMPDVLDKVFLKACPKLKIVAAALKGYDNFDINEFNQRGIWLTVVPDLLTAPTAELAVALLLALARRLLPGDDFVRSGKFSGWRPQLYGTGLDGKTVGIVGLGNVGRAIAKRLAGFDLQLLYSERAQLDEAIEDRYHVTYAHLADLLRYSDFIILCVPLSNETFHLIDREAIGQMKPGAQFVNVGRGSVVDERAVAAALTAGTLTGYAADVFELEDASRPGTPRVIPRELLQCRGRTFFTPHLGSAVADVRKKIELRAALNIIQALRGERPPDAINLPSHYRGP